MEKTSQSNGTKPDGGSGSVTLRGPCAKTVVRCIIKSPTGMAFVGENWCASPQEVCPREPGEDYTKCKTVCKQVGHAEIDALNLAGFRAEGGTAVVIGHTYACRDCQEALYGAGILNIGVRPVRVRR